MQGDSVFTWTQSTTARELTNYKGWKCRHMGEHFTNWWITNWMTILSSMLYASQWDTKRDTQSHVCNIFAKNVSLKIIKCKQSDQCQPWYILQGNWLGLFKKPVSSKREWGSYSVWNETEDITIKHNSWIFLINRSQIEKNSHRKTFEGILWRSSG